MISEHVTLCQVYGIDPTYKMTTDSYELLVERLLAKIQEQRNELAFLKGMVPVTDTCHKD